MNDYLPGRGTCTSPLTQMKRGLSLAASPRNVFELLQRLEVEAQTKLNEPRRVLLCVQRAEIAGTDVRVRIVEHHVIEHVGHLAVESRADTLRDLCGLRDAKVHVPAVEPTEITAAGTAIECGVGRSEEGKSTECVVRNGIGIGIRGQCPAVVVHRSAFILCRPNGEIGATVPEKGSLAEFLATPAVEDVERQSGGKGPYAGGIPSPYDFVDHATAGSVAFPPSEGQIIGE